MFTDYRNVKITDGYWKQKQELNRRVTIDAVYNRFYESGRIEAFKCDWKEGMDNRPHFYWDSDVAKWIEGASYMLYSEDDPALVKKIEWLIDQIEANQGEDGYFNIYYTVVEPDKRFDNRERHELYCAGHLMEAACAYYNATGRDRFLNLMGKYADYIAKVFMVEHAASFVTPGHEEIELALFKMYYTTGDKKYFDLAQFFLEMRGKNLEQESPVLGEHDYAQSHAPIRDQHEAYGHCVRAVYLYTAMADLALETGDEALLDACRDLFEDMVERKMYITGGIGSTRHGEAFTVPYDLPNGMAYTETCASIGMIFFANRMIKADPANSSKYSDIIELEMYNGALSGLSLDGEKFFYENPLEIYKVERNRLSCPVGDDHFPISQRVRLFDCSCCPPNLNRLLASIGEYFYTLDCGRRVVSVEQFGTSTFTKDDITVSQETDYPNSGKVKVCSNVPVKVRIPGWCREFKADKPYMMDGGYALFEAGEITLDFDMTPYLVACNVGVVRNLGKAAVRRGPIVYCAEGVDNSDNVHTLYIDRTKVSDAEVTTDNYFGAPTITLDGFRIENSTDTLYMPLNDRYVDAKIKLIPYASFANRGETDMLVFLSYR